MGNIDILSEIKVDVRPPKSPTTLMNLGLSVIDHVSDTRNQKQFGIKKEKPIISSNNGYRFPTFSWQWEEAHLSITDKRNCGAGLLLMAHDGSYWSERVAVQAFMVNDSLPYRGLRRVINGLYAKDVAPQLIEAQKRSINKEFVDSSPNKVQILDYLKAITTVPGLVTGNRD